MILWYMVFTCVISYGLSQDDILSPPAVNYGGWKVLSTAKSTEAEASPASTEDDKYHAGNVEHPHRNEQDPISSPLTQENPDKIHAEHFRWGNVTRDTHERNKPSRNTSTVRPSLSKYFNRFQNNSPSKNDSRVESSELLPKRISNLIPVNGNKNTNRNSSKVVNIFITIKDERAVIPLQTNSVKKVSLSTQVVSKANQSEVIENVDESVSSSSRSSRIPHQFIKVRGRPVKVIQVVPPPRTFLIPPPYQSINHFQNFDSVPEASDNSFTHFLPDTHIASQNQVQYLNPSSWDVPYAAEPYQFLQPPGPNAPLVYTNYEAQESILHPSVTSYKWPGVSEYLQAPGNLPAYYGSNSQPVYGLYSSASNYYETYANSETIPGGRNNIALVSSVANRRPPPNPVRNRPRPRPPRPIKPPVRFQNHGPNPIRDIPSITSPKPPIEVDPLEHFNPEPFPDFGEKSIFPDMKNIVDNPFSGMFRESEFDKPNPTFTRNPNTNFKQGGHNKLKVNSRPNVHNTNSNAANQLDQRVPSLSSNNLPPHSPAVSNAGLHHPTTNHKGTDQTQSGSSPHGHVDRPPRNQDISLIYITTAAPPLTNPNHFPSSPSFIHNWPPEITDSQTFNHHSFPQALPLQQPPQNQDISSIYLTTPERSVVEIQNQPNSVTQQLSSGSTITKSNQSFHDKPISGTTPDLHHAQTAPTRHSEHKNISLISITTTAPQFNHNSSSIVEQTLNKNSIVPDSQTSANQFLPSLVLIPPPKISIPLTENNSSHSDSDIIQVSPSFTIWKTNRTQVSSNVHSDPKLSQALPLRQSKSKDISLIHITTEDPSSTVSLSSSGRQTNTNFLTIQSDFVDSSDSDTSANRHFPISSILIPPGTLNRPQPRPPQPQPPQIPSNNNVQISTHLIPPLELKQNFTNIFNSFPNIVNQFNFTIQSELNKHLPAQGIGKPPPLTNQPAPPLPPGVNVNNQGQNKDVHAGVLPLQYENPIVEVYPPFGNQG